MNWYKTATKPQGVIEIIVQEKIDLLQQDTDYTCGNSVIQNLFRLMGRKIPSEKALALAMKTNSRLGTAPEAIEKYLSSVSVPFERFRPNDSLEQVLSAYKVVLVEYQDYQETNAPERVELNQSSHYALVAGFDANYFYIVDSFLPRIADTNSKIKRVPKDKFLRDWKARSFDGSEVVKQYGLIVQIR